VKTGSSHEDKQEIRGWWLWWQACSQLAVGKQSWNQLYGAFTKYSFNQDIFFHQVIQAVIQSFLKVKKFEFLPLVIGTHFHESRLETS